MSSKNFVAYGDAETLFTEVGNEISASKVRDKDISAALGAPAGAGKNLLENTASSGTNHDLTWVINSDKSVSVYGTANANTWIELKNVREINLENGKSYILTGCPSNGSANTFYMYMTGTPSINDYGEGATFLYDSSIARYLDIYVKNGTNMGTEQEPTVFYPMIRPSGTSADYVPHSDSLQAQVDSLDSAKQPKTLATPLTIGNVSRTTVEAALGALNDVTSDLSFYLENNAVTLSTSAATTVTFSSSKITTSSCIDVGVSEWGLVPDDVTVTTGSCTVTMPQVDSARTVTVRVYVK